MYGKEKVFLHLSEKAWHARLKIFLRSALQTFSDLTT